MVRHPPQGSGTPSPTLTATLDGASVSTSATAATTLKSYTVKANSLGANGTLFLDFFFTTTGTNAAKTLTVLLGGTVIFTHTIPAGTNVFSWIKVIIINRNATNSQYAVYAQFPSANQVGTVNSQTGGFAAQTATKDTTVNQVLSIQGSLANGNDSIVVNAFNVRIAFSN